VRVTWIAFVLSLAAAAGLIAFSQRLAQFGLTSSIYFIVIFPLGLAAAGFLFGALRSTASFVGTRYGATLQLGGPVVIFVMVILGGLTIARPENTFSLLVRVHGPAGPSEVIGHGKVTLDLDTDRRGPFSVSDRGEVSINEIPTQFAGKKVPLWAEVPGFAMRDSGLQMIPPSHVIYLAMVPLPPQPRKIGGMVKDGELHGVGGVRVLLPSLSVETTTNDDGHFELTVTDPGERDLLLRTERRGFLSTEQYVTAGNTDLGLVLEKTHR